MSDIKPLAIVAGAGPGLGEALLRRFSEGGYHAVGLARVDRITEGGLTVRATNLTCPRTVALVIHELIATYGAPAVVIHNPAKLVIAPFEKISTANFEDAWRSMALSAAILAHEALPSMVKAEEGTFLVTGATASLRGGAYFSAFVSAKFALRGLTQSLAREYQCSGIHVAHVILDGIIDTAASRDRHGLDPTEMMKRTDIAEAYWQLAHQPKSTWTHELGLRPMSESF